MGSTRSVQADSPALKPAATTLPALTAASATPAPLSPAKPVRAKEANVLRGIASWYGTVLDGHRTASGERFNMFALTACHPTLPFGTLVRVVNLANQQAVIVRINDRGELSNGRVIDVSYAAAEKLDITKAGLARVALEVISIGGKHSKH